MIYFRKIRNFLLLRSKSFLLARICGLLVVSYLLIIPIRTLAQVTRIDWLKEEIVATIDTELPQIYFPVIAADDHGSIHIFWTEDHAIYYLHKDEAGWTVPIDVEYSETKFFTFPSTVVDHKGILHLVWYAYGEIYYKHVPAWEATNLHKWSPTRTIAFIGGSSTPLRIDVDKKNNLHIILSDWIGRPGETTPGDVYHFYSSDQGENWSRLVKVSSVSDGELATDPRMTFDDLDNVHITWSQMAPNLSGRQQGIYYSRLSDQWDRPTSPKEIMRNESNLNWLMGANIAVSQKNTVHIVWVCGMQAQRCHSWSADGGKSWSSPQQIFTDLVGLSGWDALIKDGGGNLFLITDLRYPQAMYYSFWNGENWQDPPLIASKDEYMKLGENVMAVVGLNNRIHVVIQLGNVISYMSGRTSAPSGTPAKIPSQIDNNLSTIENIAIPTTSSILQEQPTKPQTTNDSLRLGSSELQILLVSSILVLVLNIIVGMIFLKRNNTRIG